MFCPHCVENLNSLSENARDMHRIMYNYVLSIFFSQDIETQKQILDIIYENYSRGRNK